MKQKLFAIIVVLALGLNITKAQNDDYRMTIGANAGFSLMGALIDAAADSDPTSTITSSTLPAFQGTFDYGLSKGVSIGLSFSYQKIGMGYNDPTGFIDDYDVNIGRMSIAMRTLFHYANDGKVDLYTGFRIGYKMNSVSITSTTVVYDESIWDPLIPLGFQIIPFGMRIYMTENIGINWELGIGAPHYFSAGLSFRL